MWASGGDRRLDSLLGFAMDLQCIMRQIRIQSHYWNGFLFKCISYRVMMQFLALLGVSPTCSCYNSIYFFSSNTYNFYSEE